MRFKILTVLAALLLLLVFASWDSSVFANEESSWIRLKEISVYQKIVDKLQKLSSHYSFSERISLIECIDSLNEDVKIKINLLIEKLKE